jgi:hypothetical protein
MAQPFRFRGMTSGRAQVELDRGMCRYLSRRLGGHKDAGIAGLAGFLRDYATPSHDQIYRGNLFSVTQAVKDQPIVVEIAGALLAGIGETCLTTSPEFPPNAASKAFGHQCIDWSQRYRESLPGKGEHQNSGLHVIRKALRDEGFAILGMNFPSHTATLLFTQQTLRDIAVAIGDRSPMGERFGEWADCLDDEVEQVNAEVSDTVGEARPRVVKVVREL